jgi:long-subunit acyl-CoA synthetase (AMP-forming)
MRPCGSSATPHGQKYVHATVAQTMSETFADNYSLRCSEMFEHMQQLAAAFSHAGVREGDVVAQFADNSSRWLLADQVLLHHLHLIVHASHGVRVTLFGIPLASGLCAPMQVYAM